MIADSAAISSSSLTGMSSSSLRGLVLSPPKSSNVSLSQPKVTIDVEFVDGLSNAKAKLHARYTSCPFAACFFIVLLAEFVI